MTLRQRTRYALKSIGGLDLKISSPELVQIPDKFRPKLDSPNIGKIKKGLVSDMKYKLESLGLKKVAGKSMDLKRLEKNSRPKPIKSVQNKRKKSYDKAHSDVLNSKQSLILDYYRGLVQRGGGSDANQTDLD